ncbi:hypothetical protein CLV63_102250 [Murinocardiopsis flavida]|uniref:Uncharacterized protein n=1 Tax=Murinocardiopsis flavida TaxID=645275 RepID=A0A2P8DSC6_9ACTN|nr:hypothetical protein [Murinocardiopsis flavida]PSL00124.1 hypothetical protein CLV63_102250 [Murinocardiopsis flavida]
MSQPSAPKEPVPRNDVAASLKISRELGPEYDDAIADSLAERLDHAIDARIREQLDARQLPHAQAQHHMYPSYAPPPPPPAKSGTSDTGIRLAMGIVSLALSIPLLAIGVNYGGEGIGALLAMAIVFTGVITLYLLVVGGGRGNKG